MAMIKPVDAASKGAPKPPERKHMLKPESQHFTVGTPEESNAKTPASPPGLGTREYPVLSPTVPLRHEEKDIAQNNRTQQIKNI